MYHASVCETKVGSSENETFGIHFILLHIHYAAIREDPDAIWTLDDLFESNQGNYWTIIIDSYSKIFTEPEENGCFSKITQVIITATAFSFILLHVSSSETSRNRSWAILKTCSSIELQYCNHLARGDYSKV